MRGKLGNKLSIGDWLYDWAKLYQSDRYDEILENKINKNYKNKSINKFNNYLYNYIPKMILRI